VLPEARDTRHFHRPVGDPLRILVVDDNHLIRRLLELILEGAGYVAIAVESGEAALESAGAEPPDLCIVDEAMPGMRGAEVVRALRRSADPRLSGVPVIGISGRHGGGRELLEAGADVFIPKPVDEARLLPVIARVLGAPPSRSPEDRPAV
jgi:two-component system phosphate regulon response regulator PhoB